MRIFGIHFPRYYQWPVCRMVTRGFQNAPTLALNHSHGSKILISIKNKYPKVIDLYNNNSWFGSVIWDLFCPAAVKLESSWNRSMKITLDLPYSTHRGLIEPLSDRRHLKRVLLRRFLQMITKIRSSS